MRVQERFKEQFPHTKVPHRDTVRDLTKSLEELDLSRTKEDKSIGRLGTQGSKKGVRSFSSQSYCSPRIENNRFRKTTSLLLLVEDLCYY